MVRRGNQSPTFEVVGKWTYSDGSDAIKLFKSYDIKFMPCQEHELTVYMARDKEGRFASKTISLSKPRQNGKSYAARYYAVWMAAVEGKKVLYSAHHGKTVRKMFKYLCSIFEDNADFNAMLKPGGQGIYKAAGSEGIYLVNGGMIEFATRTNSGGRGETYDLIIIDEAQELTDEQQDALKPTTLASESGDPQMLLLGTPPNSKCPGTIFRDLHKKAHTGESGGAWWMEWAATEIGDPHDIDRWYECCPALGYTVREDVLADAADTTRPDSFAREYLGWWSQQSIAEPAIKESDWSACKSSSPTKEGLLSYAVKFSLDGKTGVMAVCRKPEKGKPHIEIIGVKSTARGVKWFSDWIINRSDKIAQTTIDGKAKVDVLEKHLLDAKVPKKAVVKIKPSDFASACAMLGEAIESKSITHFGQEVLTESATNCKKRKIGKEGGWGFESTELGDAIVIEAAALAYWGAMTTKRNPTKKLRIG